MLNGDNIVCSRTYIRLKMALSYLYSTLAFQLPFKELIYLAIYLTQS